MKFLNLCSGLIRMFYFGVCCFSSFGAPSANSNEKKYPLEVLPPEHKRMADPKTGAELLFLTTAPEDDSNLYFHERSWLEDESVILFNSSRVKGGLMGY